MAIINGALGNDTLSGTTGDDVMHGFGGRDGLAGRDGNDRLFGGAAADMLFGNAGSDTIVGGAGSDIMDGGNGVDTLVTTFSDENYALNMVTGATNLAGEKAYGFENASTGNGSDAIVGSNFGNFIQTAGGNDRLIGVGGNDTLVAGNDSDTLDGGSGDDLLISGYGNDLIVCGDGNNTIIFNADPRRDRSTDRLRDFSHTDDLIKLDDAAFTVLPTGEIRANAFHEGAEATQSTHRLIYDQTTGKLFYDYDGDGAALQFLIAQFNPHTVVSIDDFLVY